MVIGTGEALDGWKEGCRSFKEEGWQDGMATHGLLFPSLLSTQGKYILTNTKETTEKETLSQEAWCWESVI